MLLNYGVGKDSSDPLHCKKIQPVHPKGDQSWVFIGRTDVEAETPILWPPDAKSWLTGKDPDAGKDWRQEQRMTEDEIVRWHHQLNGYGFRWTPGVGDGQRGLACYGSWGLKESEMTEQLNWSPNDFPVMIFFRDVHKSYSLKTYQPSDNNSFWRSKGDAALISDINLP